MTSTLCAATFSKSYVKWCFRYVMLHFVAVPSTNLICHSKKNQQGQMLLVLSSFKGTVSRVGYFFKGLFILISTFCVCADGFQCRSKGFYYPIQLLNFYSLLWNCLLILKMLTVILLRIFFSVIGRCSLVPASHWLQGKCARINLSRAASGMILQRRLPVTIFSVKIAALGFLNRVTGRIVKYSK